MRLRTHKNRVHNTIIVSSAHQILIVSSVIIALSPSGDVLKSFTEKKANITNNTVSREILNYIWETDGRFVGASGFLQNNVARMNTSQVIPVIWIT